MTARLSGRWLIVAAAAMPVAIVAGARYLSTGPAPTHAANSVAAPLIANTATLRKPTPDELRAADFANTRRDDIEPGSPFHDELFVQPAAAPADQTPAAAPDTPAPPQGPLCLVSSIMGGPVPLAVIDGKPVRVGQAVAPGWSVAAIDARARTVTLEHDDGRQIIATPGTPVTLP